MTLNISRQTAREVVPDERNVRQTASITWAARPTAGAGVGSGRLASGTVAQQD
jgi:hypothetical protein